MQTSTEVREEFKKELKALLSKWGATIEANDYYPGYPESGEDIRIIVTIPAIYSENGLATEREYTEIDFRKSIWNIDL